MTTRAPLLAALLLFIATAALPAGSAIADDPAAFPAQYGTGSGPAQGDDGIWHLLNAETTGQANSVAFARQHTGAFERRLLSCKLRVNSGGDGGSIIFLNTHEYGLRGPAPYLASAVEPGLRGTFAVGIDVHNPANTEPFGPWGNYQALPEREVSLHFDGRELVKRVAPAEFRDRTVDCVITIDHVPGGAAISVKLGDSVVFDRYFVANLLPYESRLAFAAGTRDDAMTQFDVSAITEDVGAPAARRRPPLHIGVFNHVLTDNSKTAYTADVELPPAEWHYGRVIMTIDIHDAGDSWDEWDRCGEVSLIDADGKRWGLVPFITSYRTECHWAVDVTHFRPWLAGKTRLEVAAGTTFYKNRGYMMSVSLDYHHGAPALVPTRVVPLWVGTAHYGSAENHFADFFEPRTVEIGKDTTAAMLFVTTTGHSQVGEFTPSKRTITFTPPAAGSEEAPPREPATFANTLWKSDCYLNPNRPQAGTWKYSRAGWAPGDVVRPWWIDLTPHLAGAGSYSLAYAPQPYEFEGEAPPAAEINAASHIVRAYLIEYGTPAAAVTPPSLVIADVKAGSNAATAGIQAGDYLASYNGSLLDSIDDLRAAIAKAAAARLESVPVVIYRGSSRLELSLAPGPMGISLGSR